MLKAPRYCQGKPRRHRGPPGYTHRGDHGADGAPHSVACWVRVGMLACAWAGQWHPWCPFDWCEVTAVWFTGCGSQREPGCVRTSAGGADSSEAPQEGKSLSVSGHGGRAARWTAAGGPLCDSARVEPGPRVKQARSSSCSHRWVSTRKNGAWT